MDDRIRSSIVVALSEESRRSDTLMKLIMSEGFKASDISDWLWKMTDAGTIKFNKDQRLALVGLD